MFDTFAGSILQSGLTPVLFLICTAVSLLLGLGTALIYMHRSHYSKSFVITLALLPAMVQLVIMLVNSNVYYLLQLTRSGLAHLQLWRLVSFVFSPSLTMNPLFFALEVYLVYWIGTSLERAWGAFTFDVYFLLGMAGAWVSCLLTGWGSSEALFYSLFFAFAALYPNMQVLLFFFIPIKIKWLAYLDAALFAYQFLLGTWQTRAAILASLLNCLIFFGPSVLRQIRDNLRYRKQREDWRRQMRR